MRSTSKAEAAFARGLVPVLTRVRAVASRLGASRWAAPLGRVALFAAGLVLLAVIGNSALARPPKALGALTTALPLSSPDAFANGDAGVTVVAPPTGASATSVSAPPPARDPESGSHGGRATPDDPVVLNSASVEDFQRLPGVGPKRARAIFDLRAHIGKFRHVEDLLRVKGIGRNTLKKLRPLVRLDTPAAVAGSVNGVNGALENDAGIGGHGS